MLLLVIIFYQFFSLLTDEDLMTPENLIFDNWQKPAAAFTKHTEGVFKKINSGSAYKDFVKKLCDPENTINLPTILFEDGTVIDGAQRKPLEPFSFSTKTDCKNEFSIHKFSEKQFIS